MVTLTKFHQDLGVTDYDVGDTRQWNKSTTCSAINDKAHKCDR